MSDDRKRYPVGTRVRKYEFFDGRQWVDGEVIEPEDREGFYTVDYDDGDVEEYTSTELDRLVQWKSLQVGRRIRLQLPVDKEKSWKTGVIVKFRPQRRKAFQIRFDGIDGDSDNNTLQWLSFLDEKFEILVGCADKLNEVKSKSPVSADHFRQLRQSIKIGDRLEIQSDEDRLCYPGTVTKYKKGQYFFECDDGDQGWVDLGKTVYRHLSSAYDKNLENRQETLSRSKKRRRGERENLPDSASVKDENKVELMENPVAVYELPESASTTESMKPKSPVSTYHCQQERQSINVGDRLEFLGDEDGLYYPGTVTKYKKGHCFFKCDDGDQGWVDLSKTAYRHLANEAVKCSRSKKRRRIERRVSVDSIDLNDENDVAMLNISVAGCSDPLVDRNIRPLSNAKMRHRKQCSLAESSTEYRLLMDESVEKPVILVDTGKEESEVDEDPRHSRRQNGAEEQIIPGDDAVQPARDRDETCPLCHAAVMMEPRATPCHHLFCKACIEKHVANNRSCPQCHFVSNDFQLCDEISSPFSFRQVECIDKFTGEVCEVYSSASCASMTAGRSAIRIIGACHSKQRDDREHRGYYWRFHGSKGRILRVGERSVDGFAIEQICLKSGKVLATYPSLRKAEEKTGVNGKAIKRVAERRGKANGGGFFWRYRGDNHGPWKDPLPANSKAVEQLDLTSGEVIREFESHCAAKKALGKGMDYGCIRETCEGKHLSALGFFWRWKGSQNLPNVIRGNGKRVLLRRSKGGPVVKQFPNASRAAAEFSIPFWYICRWCREESRGAGYFWSYAPEVKKTLDENAGLVNKRIRVLRPTTDEWMEGKLIAYNPLTGEHTIKYDSGDTVLLHLNGFDYKFKNDQGQKPVEKLSLETGEVLQTFSSLREAAMDLGLKQEKYKSISNVLRGVNRQSRGFFYRYQGSKALPRQNVKNKRAVEQLCLKTGRVLATFDSIRDAATAVGITAPGISNCCNGRNHAKSAGGFGWRFAESPAR